MSEVSPVEGASSWNVDTLKRHMDALFESRDRATDIAFASQEKLVAAMLESAKEAVTKAEVSVDKRLEALNEMRQTVSDQQKTYATRADIDNLKEIIARLDITLVRAGSEKIGQGAYNDRLAQWVPILIAFIALTVALLNTGRIGA